VSLLEDARRDVSPGQAEAMIARFLARRSDLDRDDFRRGYDLLGAQRNAKIVGIFARLCVRDGKPRYLSMIPRVWAHLMRDVADLPGLRGFIGRHVPAPTADILARIEAEYAQ
jgi:aminoglycoside/choline kinase family phosphotransferase